MFPSHVQRSELATVLAVLAASVAAVARFGHLYSTDQFLATVALLLAADTVFVWALLRKDSLRRQRALGPERIPDGENSK